MSEVKSHNPAEVAAPVGNYTHGLEVGPGCRWLFVSGQIPTDRTGHVPAGFEEQCEAVWQNIERVLAQAEMTVANLVKVTTFLTDKSQADANGGGSSRRHLGDHRPALTVIVAQTLDSEWLLEIEAIAAAQPV